MNHHGNTSVQQSKELLDCHRKSLTHERQNVSDAKIIWGSSCSEPKKKDQSTHVLIEAIDESSTTIANPFHRLTHACSAGPLPRKDGKTCPCI